MFPARIYVGQIVTVFAIVLAAIWGATQWVAGTLGHQAALGPAWFAVAGYPVYLPWRLFEWWYAYDAYAPHVFERAGTLAASGGVAGALFAILNSVWRARQSQLVTTFGSARWATVKEIAAAGLFRPKGVFLGRVGDQYLRHDGPEHVMCFAPTRSGKGVGLVLPTLLSWTSSAVVHDIKGENWQLTAGWRSQFSHCLLFDPTDVRSARYNPLLEVRKGACEVRDVQNIADILVDPEGSIERRNHWEKTSHALLVGVILHVLYGEERKTLARVTELLADPAQSFEKTLRIMLGTNHLGTAERPQVHPVVAATARELLNKSENERSGVLSTAVSFLGLYRDPTIARNTEVSDWRIADLVAADKPVTLYLVVPPSDISRTKPLIRLVLNQIGRRLTETLDAIGDEPKKRQLLLMLDEFPALGRLDFFESALAFMAGYGIRTYLIAQSLNQIAKAYGENNAILDNCHVRIAFAANDERTAKRISDALGTATELRAQRNYAGHRLAPWLGHVMISRQETARPLLTPGEVMQLPQDEAIVLLSGLPPIRARKLRHYEDANFTARLKSPPRLGSGVYPDLPRPHRDDWSGQRRAVDLRLATLSYRELMEDAADHRQLQLTLADDPTMDPALRRSEDEPVADDDTDAGLERRQMQRVANAMGGAHAMTRDDDDLLPAF
jgi:type IV secretion system protein VirD4